MKEILFICVCTTFILTFVFQYIKKLEVFKIIDLLVIRGICSIYMLGYGVFTLNWTVILISFAFAMYTIADIFYKALKRR